MSIRPAPPTSLTLCEPPTSLPQPAANTITIRGAREHNLAGIDLVLPKEKLIVLTGPSGSGKSSLAFDTLYAEARRRFLDSLSVYARHFIGEMKRPAFEQMTGLGPTIAIDQGSATANPRSTVGTITEAWDFMRLLWGRAGVQHCPTCDVPVTANDPGVAARQIMALPEGTACILFAPLVRQRKGHFKDLIESLQRAGFTRVRVDGALHLLETLPVLRKTVRHDIDLVVDRVKVRPNLGGRLLDSLQVALHWGKGEAFVEWGEPPHNGTLPISLHLSCPQCHRAFPEVSPQSFSFNSPIGMCADCQGLGTREHMSPHLVVPDPSLSVADGAIAPWRWAEDPRAIQLDPEVLTAVASHWSIDLSAPFSALTDAQRRALLFGADDTLSVKWKARGVVGHYPLVFKGVLDDLLHRFQRASKESVRDFLAPFVIAEPCTSCQGTRLRPESRGVRLAGRGIGEVDAMTIDQAKAFFTNLSLEGSAAAIAREILPPLVARLSFVEEVGLSYLQLKRPGPSLSGGESQRIRLATQLGSGLTGVTYVLDEPSIGLHPRDQDRLLDTLFALRDRGNTIVVVEHDEATMRAADHLVDFGPGAGRKGGHVTFSGPPAALPQGSQHSLTAQYLLGERVIPLPAIRRAGNGQALRIVGARRNNLQGIDVTFPLQTLIGITGVSGAGKSTLINDILVPGVRAALAKEHSGIAGCAELHGAHLLDRVIEVDQMPIGRTPRSNPATYTKVFDWIRKHFANLPESRVYGYGPGRFSFNVTGGRCEDCQGSGVRTLEMRFLANVYVPCTACFGKRFNEATLRAKYRGHAIADVLAMSVGQAADLFADHPKIQQILQTLLDVGLSYLPLGQPSPTLSGGEAQRVKLSRELARSQVGHTLYVLDEPSTGLHFEDIRALLQVLHRLVDLGNTVVVIEHNLEMIKCADRVIDLGPEGGAAGGRIVACGTPEEVAATAHSHTGRYLRALLSPTAAPSPGSLHVC